MAKGDLKHIAATLAILGGLTEPEEKKPARVNKASQDDVSTDMNTPTMIFRITTEYHDLSCSVPWTPELRETIRKRGEMIASVAEVDERVNALSFFWYGLDVRQFELPRILLGQVYHVRRHVDADHPALGSDGPGRQEAVDAAAAAEIHDGFAGP